MASAGVVGLTSGKRVLSTSIYSSEFSEKLLMPMDHGSGKHQSSASRAVIVAKRSSNFSPNPSSNKGKQAIRAVKEKTDVIFLPSTTDSWFKRSDAFEEEEDSAVESSIEAMILLQKSMLEKQWNLSYNQARKTASTDEIRKNEITRSGLSARERRNRTRSKCLGANADVLSFASRGKPIASSELRPIITRGYLWSHVPEKLLSHAEVVNLSKKIKIGLDIENHRDRLAEIIGCKPTDKQLASSLLVSRAELQSKLIESSLAREKLALGNIRLVLSLAQKYENMGAEMADLVQGGLSGLLRGIEKFDSSRGFKFSTYAYWWIRQGISKVLADNLRMVRLPTHLHERLYSIRHAKINLENQGIAPTIQKIAEVLNMSERKVRNATEAVSTVVSLDRDAFASLSGSSGETHHSYIADTHPENNPWNGFQNYYIKDEVNKLLSATLNKREQDIIRLYHGLERECHSWEDISHRMGLSRERVRQIGLVAMEKLKHVARRKRMDAILVKHHLI